MSHSGTGEVSRGRAGDCHCIITPSISDAQGSVVCSAITDTLPDIALVEGTAAGVVLIRLSRLAQVLAIIALPIGSGHAKSAVAAL